MSANQQFLLSAITADAENLERALAEGLSIDWFTCSRCQEIAETILSSRGSVEHVDDIYLVQHLRKSGRADLADSFLDATLRYEPSSIRLSIVISELRHAAANRTIKRQASTIVEIAERGEDASDAIAKLSEAQARLERDGKPPEVFADFEEILKGPLTPEVPTVCAFKDGVGALFYRGRLNEIHSAPGLGKSNVQLAAVSKVLRAGGGVVFVDPEDSPTAFARKLLAFGATPEEVARVRYTNDATPASLQAVLRWSRKNPPELLCLDGLAETLAAHGLSEDSATDFLQFVAAFLRPMARLGSCVVIADHVVKSKDNQGRWSRGSGAKLGAYDGVSYELKPGRSYGPNREGFVKLAVSKDRNGGVGSVGANVAEIWFSPDGRGKTQVSINQAVQTSGTDFKPTAIMEKIIDHLKKHPDASKRDLRSLGKSQFVDSAIEALKDEGRLKASSLSNGRPIRFEVIEPDDNEIIDL